VWGSIHRIGFGLVPRPSEQVVSLWFYMGIHAWGVRVKTQPANQHKSYGHPVTLPI